MERDDDAEGEYLYCFVIILFLHSIADTNLGDGERRILDAPSSPA